MSVMEQAYKGGFVAEKEFGFMLPTRFPNLDLTEVDTSGVALVVQIADARHLNVHYLGRVLIGAASGGVKTAVVCRRGEDSVKAFPLGNFWLMVNETDELKRQLIAERRIRAAG
ncbi:hypothetical protein [Streptomyces buecherae]|uniref:hypothetical protein n=1 Tax=Streptomyces buecherae TaxID=2763006 RepID=UPI003797FA00